MGNVSKFYPRHMEAVTPHDTNANNFMCLYVGTQGDLVVRGAADDANVTLVGISGFVPIEVSLVLATGTTATNIVGFRIN